MTASVFAFPERKNGPQPWTNDELAELYRVVDILGRAGLAVDTELGLSDEGDPWFVFCRRDTGDVVAHFARISGQFLAASVAVDETYRGANFRQIIERMVSSQPLILPPSPRGGGLLLHPAVVLTAFVATALAHSEKMMAVDWLRSVDAEWDHRPDAASAGKHAKHGWLDSLQALLKAPLGDAKMAHEPVNKEGQALTLASLIAIAMSALQPIIEKVSAISQLVADEVTGQSHVAPTDGGSHAIQALADMPTIDGAITSQNDQDRNRPQHDEAQHAHETVAPATDAANDGIKVVADNAALHGATNVSKLPSVDDVAHPPLAAASWENTSEANSGFLLMQQKMAAAMTVSAETSANTALHTDSVTAPLVITIDEVSQQALQLFNIHLSSSGDKTDNSAAAAATGAHDASSSPTSPPSASGATDVPPASAATASASESGAANSANGSGEATLISPPTQQVSSGPLVVQAPLTPSQVTVTASDTIIDVQHTDPSAVINAIANFVTSGAHVVTQSVVPSASLENELSPYFSGNGSSLQVILFDTTNPTSDVISFAPGIVLVEEKVLSATQLSNPGGNLVLDVSGGGTVTLVGVALVGQHLTV